MAFTEKVVIAVEDSFQRLIISALVDTDPKKAALFNHLDSSAQELLDLLRRIGKQSGGTVSITVIPNADLSEFAGLLTLSDGRKGVETIRIDRRTGELTVRVANPDFFTPTETDGFIALQVAIFQMLASGVIRIDYTQKVMH